MQIIGETVKDILSDSKLSKQQKVIALDTVHNLIKSIKEKAPSESEISEAHQIYEKMWYKIWSFVQVYDRPSLGVIVKYNQWTWMYDGKRYPIIVQFPFWTFEYSIFTTHYDDIEKYKNTPKNALKDWENDLTTKVIDIDEDVAEKVMASQKLLDEMSEEELISYSQLEWFKNQDLPYVKEFVNNKITRRIINRVTNMKVEDLMQYFESEKFKEERLDEFIEQVVLDNLKRKLSEINWEILLKYYEKGDYSQELKSIIWEILETK